MSLSFRSSAVRYLSLGVYCAHHTPRRLRTRRKSKPRKPKLSPRPRSTFRLFSSLISTCSSANSSRSRFSTAPITPKLKKRTALLRKLKDVFRRFQSQPVDRVIKVINPMLRGWVTYFAVGNSSECFGFIKDWVEKKIRRHMARARNRKGFGWKRWSTQWLYESLRLYNGYKVRWTMPKVAPAR